MIAAVVQLTSTDDVTRNVQHARTWITEAAHAGATLIALPENFGFMGQERDVLQHAQSVEDGPFIAPLRQLARDLHVSILAGSMPERGPTPDHIYNTSVLIGADGNTVAIYRKIHLFDVDLAGHARYLESAHVIPGEKACLTSLDHWPIGLSVCYDVRFPELYRHLRAAGARILTVPAAFTLHTGKDHWEPLLRARAIENQCYVLAPGQFGSHGHGRTTWGKSMIIDPWGHVIAMVSEGEGFAVARLDPIYQDRIRAQIPCEAHRRHIA